MRIFITLKSTCLAVLHVSWALLNVVLLVGALYLLKPLSKWYGRLQVGLCLVVLVVMCQSANKKSFSNPKPENFQTIQTISNSLVSKLRPQYVLLLDMTTCSVSQDIYLTRNGQSDSVQITSYISMTGWLSGFYWSTIGTQVTLQSDRRLHYSTVGALDWRLLGLPVYRQLKQFDGYIEL